MNGQPAPFDERTLGQIFTCCLTFISMSFAATGFLLTLYDKIAGVEDLKNRMEWLIWAMIVLMATASVLATLALLRMRGYGVPLAAIFVLAGALVVGAPIVALG